MSRNYASIKLGTENLAQDLKPYFKFSWHARFEFADGSGDPLQLATMTLKTCELPRWTADTQVVNTYNHKTIVQTRLNYEPITMSFYDQLNDSVENMMWHFVKGQFDPTDGSKAGTIRPMTVTIKMHKTWFGTTDLDENLESTDDSAKEKIYILKNAYIVDAQHDTLDYSASDTVLWTLTLRYEDLEWVGGFEGETPSVSTGIAAKPLQPPTPTSKPVPPSKPIPDADVGLTQMEVEYGIGPNGEYSDAAYSKERPTKEKSTPGAESNSVYAGYQTPVTTADITMMEAEYGIGADGGYSDSAYSASSGAASAVNNTGTPSASRSTTGVSAAVAAAKTAEPKSLSSAQLSPIETSKSGATRQGESSQINKSSPVRPSQRYQDLRDSIDANRRNMSLDEYRRARKANSADYFKNVNIKDF